ncbi:MAG TPA: cupin domain-containing protein [Vicinamibacterales bacterium]|jgi:hypothetical protein|nr:cupin domain-containing protein [Vicinamibacterales bacterium]
MNISRIIKWGGFAAVALFLSVTASGQASVYKPAVPEGFVRMDMDDIPAQTTTLMGDPSKPGLYVVRNLFKAGPGGGKMGGGSRPHYHDQDRLVTVIKGTWWVALGPDADVYNPDKMTPMKAGSFVFHPANGHHYDGAKDEDVIVQIIGMGPVKTINIPQAGDPPPGQGRRGAGAGGAAPAPGAGR